MSSTGRGPRQIGQRQQKAVVREYESAAKGKFETMGLKKLIERVKSKREYDPADALAVIDEMKETGPARYRTEAKGASSLR